MKRPSPAGSPRKSDIPKQLKAELKNQHILSAKNSIGSMLLIEFTRDINENYSCATKVQNSCLLIEGAQWSLLRKGVLVANNRSRPDKIKSMSILMKGEIIRNVTVDSKRMMIKTSRGHTLNVYSHWSPLRAFPAWILYRRGRPLVWCGSVVLDLRRHIEWCNWRWLRG
jgi:hypothetical protein